MSSKENKSPVLNRQEAAKLARLPLGAVDAAIRNGELETVIVGRRRLVLRAPLEAAIQKHQSRPKPQFDPESALAARLQRSRSK
jgi:hypothetical protein